VTNFDAFSDICYNLNKEKSLSVLNAMNNYMTFGIISLITVFIPLAFTLPTHYPELVSLFKMLVVFALPQCLTLYGYLTLRYVEYRSLYEAQLVESLVLRLYISSKENPNMADFIADNYGRILRVTSFITSFNIYKTANYLDIVKHNARMASFKDRSYAEREIEKV